MGKELCPSTTKLTLLIITQLLVEFNLFDCFIQKGKDESLGCDLRKNKDWLMVISKGICWRYPVYGELELSTIAS
jgi:hypothetical protein